LDIDKTFYAPIEQKELAIEELLQLVKLGRRGGTGKDMGRLLSLLLLSISGNFAYPIVTSLECLFQLTGHEKVLNPRKRILIASWDLLTWITVVSTSEALLSSLPDAD
jgi:hypothetical protein